MSVGITVEDEFFYNRGDIISHKKDIPTVTDTFKGNLFWLGKNDLVKDKKYKLKLATLEIECEIEKIDRVVNASSLETIEDGEKVCSDDIAEITIKTKEPIALDEFADIEVTGRFVLVDDLDVSGGGIITKASSFEVEKKFQAVDGEIYPLRPRLVSHEDREARLGTKTKIVWVTGRVGCGKRQIAVNLEKELFDQGKNVYYLDYDQVVKDKNDTNGISKVTQISKILKEAGNIVIVSSDYLLAEEREYIKSELGREYFTEIYVEAPDSVCSQRVPGGNTKDLNERSNEPFISLYIDKVKFDAAKKAKSLIDVIF